MFHFKALFWGSIILLLPPPTCKAYPIVLLEYDHCAIYALPPTPLFYAIHYTILVMAISCKGQPISYLCPHPCSSPAVSQVRGQGCADVALSFCRGCAAPTPLADRRARHRGLGAGPCYGSRRKGLS